MDDNWIYDELITGIQKLMCLSLDRTPAADMIEGTVAAWREAICDGKRFDQDIDAPRFRAAFTILAKSREKWPAPRHFLEAMPDRPEPPPLKRIESQSSKDAARKAIKELSEKLRMQL